MTIAEARAYIERKEQQIKELTERYGQGVRPGWVGEEIAILAFYKQDAERQLAEMESNNDAD